MSETPPELTPALDEPLWHYAVDGSRLGPVSKRHINRLIAEAKITRDTKLWTKGWAEWQEAHLTEFGRHFTATPPALTGEAVNNTWIWVLAFVPLAFWLIRFSIASNFVAQRMQGQDVPEPDFSLLILPNIAANILVSWLDARALKKAGHDTEKFKGWVWIVPVYMFVRAKELKQSKAPFFVWLVLWILSL